MPMPELPEVETTRIGLAAALEGRRIEKIELRRTDLRFPLPPDFAARICGRTVTRVARRAKFLLIDLDDGQVLIAHLGMSGRFKIFAAGDVPAVDRHDHVLFETGNGGAIRYHDPRRFGFMDLTTRSRIGEHAMLKNLGPEPLGPDFSVDYLNKVLAGRKGPAKSVLLDQRIVAGLGNIYVCEALYWAGISPRRRAGTIPGARAERLVRAVKRVLEAAIAAGGSSLRDFHHTDGRLGYFQTKFAVYRREGEPCPVCAEHAKACAVRRIVQSGRSSFYCPTRQR